ncbi:MAG: acetyl-CoA carboxylase, biotin carboxyl carrier protein [Butyrivibrio sp.]|uniref:acetyl-CoA carboxylase biotin carboxyl carrier protein n=1 Tax=Butyrivibrio sp. TaxID=28121 RepID=UPI001B0872EB|nr:acetyl-CoA carboxylase biotin carboxyl carrier protein subunit [Butyrivibrio sp.]MBO6240497.1 acetyl-CoA carboxylase, biotin carboxyl carrier protein [Butyrivibrio sp.]
MNNSLKDYEEMFERLGLSEMEVSEGGFSLKLKKNSDFMSKGQQEVKETIEKPEQDQKKTGKDIEGTEVKAPLLGVFYGSVNGKSAIDKGDAVKKGDVLCTLEAMKMMNEVKSPVDGTVTEVCAHEGDLVEFDQVLFVIS